MLEVGEVSNPRSKTCCEISMLYEPGECKNEKHALSFKNITDVLFVQESGASIRRQRLRLKFRKYFDLFAQKEIIRNITNQYCCYNLQ